MADITPDFTKKVLVDIELKADQLKRDLPAILVEIEDLTQKQKKLTAESKIGTKEFVNNAQQLRALKAEVRDTNKYVDNATKAIHAQTGSIQQNRAILSLTTADYVKLNQAEGQTAASTQVLGANVAALTEKLKAQEFEIKQTYRNVGNYTESINKSNIALQKAGSGIQVFKSINEGLTKVTGFLPSVSGSAAQAATMLNGVYSGLSATVQNFTVGFKTSWQLIEEAKAAEDNLTLAKQNATAAIIRQEEATEAFTAGEISNIAAQVAAIEAEKAQAAALTAQAVATEAVTAATEASSQAMRLFKIALASTGIGLLIIALASLAEYFTNTNDGAKEFQVIQARLGATTDILKGKVAELGRELFNFSNGLDENGKKLDKAIGNDSLAKWGKYIKKVDDLGKSAKDSEGFFKKLLDTITDFQRYIPGTKSVIDDLIHTKAKPGEDSLSKEIKAAADQAEKLTRQRQALTISEREYNNTTKIEEQTELGVQSRRIRNMRYTTEERKAAAEKAKEISKSLYTTELNFAMQSQKIIEGEQALRAKAGVKVDKVALAEAKGRILTLKGQFAQEQEMLDVREARVEKMAGKEADRAEKLREKREASRIEAIGIQKESAARELQDIYEAYGDKVIAADIAYNKETVKLKKFLAEKLITQEVYNTVDAQLQHEHNANISKIIDEFRLQDAEKFKQVQNNLIKLHNDSIDNDTERTIAGLKQKNKEENQQIDAQNIELEKSAKQLQTEINQLSGKAQDEARERRDNELIAIQQNEAKRIALAAATAKEIAKVNRQAGRDKIAAQDEADVLASKRNTNLFSNGGQQAAELKATTDKYNWEISEAQRAGKETVLLEQQKIDAIKAINDNYRNQKIEFAVQTEQQIQSAAFDIISQGMQQSAEHALNILAKQKTAELANSSLTATQKTIINNKYQKEEDAAKRKAFYANQKLQAAEVLINAAVAVIKTISEMGYIPAIPFIAAIGITTALSEAKILSAKPGFAQGGEFKSDGRGAILPGYSKHDNTNATLRSGEAVVVSEAMRVPWARNQVSRINEMFGGRSFSTPGPKPAFLNGGIFTDGGNANRYYSQPVYDSEGLANSLAYQLINNFPPVMVDVKDINNQQGIRAKTIDRVNL